MADGFANLIFLDPPFNSKRCYKGFVSNTHRVAFDDTWKKSEDLNDDFHEMVQIFSNPEKFVRTMKGFRLTHGGWGIRAGLPNSNISNRLREDLHILKQQVQFTLMRHHITISHSPKLVMDAIFEWRNFKNEFVWC